MGGGDDRPLPWCGDVRVREGHSRDGEGRCSQCSWHLDRRFTVDDGPRDAAAAWLLGLHEQDAPVGLGARVGLRWFHELSPERRVGARTPFAWHTDDDVVTWREELGLNAPALPNAVPGPRQVGRAIVTPR